MCVYERANLNFRSVNSELSIKMDSYHYTCYLEAMALHYRVPSYQLNKGVLYKIVFYMKVNVTLVS